LAGLSILSVLTYLLVSAIYYRIGFPLDDSWIHQTYARNLAFSGEWAFLPGEPSGGSTSPLWTAIISIGYLFHIAPLVWTFGLGIFILWGVANFAEIAIRRSAKSYHPAFPWVGLIIVFEWHFVWAAASGMETLLFSGVVLWVLFSLTEEIPQYFKIGLLIGLSIWLRPDGLTLLGPAFMVAILNKSPIKLKMRHLVSLILGFGGVFSLYLLFSLALTGNPWPTTFYAKQAEYEILLKKSLLERMGELSIQLLVGVGSVLVPGYFLTMIKSIRERNWGLLAGFFWALGFLGLYAWRLPVVYQHGRYVIPVILVFCSFSCIGLVEYFQKTIQGWRWVIRQSWKIGGGLILLIFWGYGSIVYARDVAIIESEMVVMAGWIDDNLPKDALIAAHDIGALGYFGDHKIIDLAGLISPEVIPFLRDEELLKNYLIVQNVDYLVTFPEWYPILNQGLLQVYSTNGKFSPSVGGENMVLFKWKY
jgi:hypothetical protein